MNNCRVNGIGELHLEMLLQIGITLKIILGLLCTLDE